MYFQVVEDDSEEVTHKVYFDVQIDGKSAGMLLFLFSEKMGLGLNS